MNVRELIRQLQELPPELPVFVMEQHIQAAEPCYGAWEGVFDINDWDGGGITCDLVLGDAFVSIG